MAMTQKQISRRQFIKDSSIKLAGTSLLLNQINLKPAFGSKMLTAEAAQKPDMEYRVLGRTGLKVTAVSFGVMRLKEPAVLVKALDLGINFFDTAHSYQNGNNEKLLGKVMKDYGRKKALIMTKIHPFQMSGTPHMQMLGGFQMHDRKTLDEMMDKSLKRLQTDYVDVLLVHNIMEKNWVTNEDVLSFLEGLKQKGKARFVGFSVHDPRVYVEAIDTAIQNKMYDVVLAWINFKSPPEHSEALKRAKKANIGTVAMKTQAGGGGYQAAAEGSVSPQQAALRWALQNDIVDCAIPGMVNIQQLEENVGALGKKISWHDRKTLHAYYNAVKHQYCVMCGKCGSTCSNQIDRYTVNRALMYCEGYRDFEQGRQTYLSLNKKQNALACMSCTAPTCRCVNGIPIAERMRYAHRLFT
jgi:aryl-alcohol dehydrogenase-like predicted oxidoreductase